MLQIPVTIDAMQRGALCFNRDAVRKLSSVQPTIINITAAAGADRRAVEHFIEQVYTKAYGAQITQHYPTLVSVRDAKGNILAALGFRSAAEHSLFLEHYLSVPIEQAISSAFAKPIPRAEVVEVGNLASAGHGAAVFLFAALMAYLDCMGYRHLALTGTRVLRGYFAKLGLDPRDMGAADPTCLPDAGKSWGSYYDTQPRLIGGDVHASFLQLQRVMLVEQAQQAGAYATTLHPRTPLC